MGADTPLPRLVASRRAVIHPLLVKRASDAKRFNHYASLAEDLPHWLRQHGLRLTLDYLHLLAFARGRAEAAALLADWADAVGEPGQLSFPRLMLGLDPSALSALGATDQLRLQALAMVDAEALRQGCKSIGKDPPSPRPQAWNPAECRWPTLPAHRPLSIADCRHPGLAWRFAGTVPRSGTEALVKTYREEQVRKVAHRASCEQASAHHAWYRAAYRRRERWLRGIGVEPLVVPLRSRLFVGLGERGVWETHVLLHPAGGMPFIPSSQVKSLIRRTMVARIARLPEPSRQPMRQLLDELLGVEHGGSTRQGCMVVHDAWWVPDSAPSPLSPDLDNPHHAKYFQCLPGHDSGTGSQALDLADAKYFQCLPGHDIARPQDSPEPQPQMGVRGQMQFALGLPGQPELLQRCLRWLRQALQQRGIGGRSHATGAGRFAEPLSPPTMATEPVPALRGRRGPPPG